MSAFKNIDSTIKGVQDHQTFGVQFKADNEDSNDWCMSVGWIQFVRETYPPNDPMANKPHSISTGTWHKAGEWYLDVRWTDSEPIFYDDDGIHIRQPGEMDIFDEPSVDNTETIEFKDFLIAEEITDKKFHSFMRPYYEVDWTLHRDPAGKLVVEATGHPVDSFGDMNIAKWRLGYSAKSLKTADVVEIDNPFYKAPPTTMP